MNHHTDARPRLLGGALVTDVDTGSVHRADLLIAGGRIAALGEPGTVPAPAEAERLDMSRRLLIPGLVNVHTHGHGYFSAGMGDRWPLELLIAAGPWISGGRTLQDKALIGLIGAVELVAKGTTTCFDLYAELPLPTDEGIAALAEAYAHVGIRATIAPMMSDTSFYDAIPGLRAGIPAAIGERLDGIRPAPWNDTVAACRSILRQGAPRVGDTRLALGPTIPLHCSEPFMRACGALAAEHDVLLQTHLAESRIQAAAAMERYGHSLVSEMNRLGLLGRRFSAAHAIWLDDADLERLAESGAAVAHNAGSNLRLGTGLARARDMLDRGVTLGIGTDTCSCSDNLNMFEAMRYACLASRVRDPDHERWLTAPEVLRAATVGGARLLGRDHEIGRLRPGYLADIVCLDLARPQYLPLNDAVRQVVFGEDGTGVDRVLVGGRDVVIDGEVVGIDPERLRQDAESALDRLTRKVAPMRALFEDVEPHVAAFYRARVKPDGGPGSACEGLD